MKTQAKIKIMQAFVDGKEIEFKHENDPWETMCATSFPDPVWNWDFNEYRIKLEPRVIYISESVHGYHVSDCPSEAISLNQKVFKFQEVIE